MISVPWRCIEYDQGTATLVGVTEDCLKDFRTFMHCVLKEKIGMDKGVFKVRLADDVETLSPLADLMSYIQQYFQTEVSFEEDSKDIFESKPRKPHFEQQRFFYGLQKDDLYGSCKEGALAESIQIRNTTVFLKKIADSETFSNQATCCVNKLNESIEALDIHYWKVVRDAAEFPSCGFDDFLEKNDVEYLKKEANCLRSSYRVETGLWDKGKDCSFFEKLDGAERTSTNPVDYLRTRKASTIFCAPCIPLREKVFPICPRFCLSDLRTVLDLHQPKISRVFYPYLLVGTAHASFAWHMEDAATFSISYLHYGAPRVWFFVPPQQYKQFQEWCYHFNLDLAQVSCKNILGAAHKYVIASKAFLAKLGISVHVVVQREKEIVITYPFSAHSGFNTGWNIQQSANFGDEWWVEPALLATPCECFPHIVRLDLSRIIAVCRPHLLSMYKNRDTLPLLRELSKNPFIQELDLLPQSFNNLKHCTQAAVEDAWLCENNSEVTVPALQAKGVRLVLKCLANGCGKLYEGGRSKLPRLIQHVKRSMVIRKSWCKELSSCTLPRELSQKACSVPFVVK